MASNTHANNEAGSNSGQSIIGQLNEFLASLCCRQKKNKVNPVTKKESKNDHRSHGSPSNGIQRSPTPGPDSRGRKSEIASSIIEPKIDKIEEATDAAEAAHPVEELPPETQNYSSNQHSNEHAEPIDPSASDANLPKIDIPPEDLDDQQQETSLGRGFHSDSTLSMTDRPRIRPEGAGIRSGAVSRSLQHPFPEYELSGSSHSGLNSYYSSDLEGTCSLKELEEYELDIDDWGEGFDSDRTPRPASKITMQSNTETIRKRGLFQNKKSQAIETPPSSDRKSSGDGTNRTCIFQQPG